MVIGHWLVFMGMCVFLPEAWRRGAVCVCAVAVAGRRCNALESVPGWVEDPWGNLGIQSPEGGLGRGRSRGREPVVWVSLRGQQPPPLQHERRPSKGGGDWEEE